MDEVDPKQAKKNLRTVKIKTSITMVMSIVQINFFIKEEKQIAKKL